MQAPLVMKIHAITSTDKLYPVRSFRPSSRTLQHPEKCMHHMCFVAVEHTHTHVKSSCKCIFRSRCKRSAQGVDTYLETDPHADTYPDPDPNAEQFHLQDMLLHVDVAMKIQTTYFDFVRGFNPLSSHPSSCQIFECSVQTS